MDLQSHIEKPMNDGIEKGMKNQIHEKYNNIHYSNKPSNEQSSSGDVLVLVYSIILILAVMYIFWCLKDKHLLCFKQKDDTENKGGTGGPPNGFRRESVT